MIPRVAIRINPPDLLIDLHIFEDAIPTLRAAFQVTTASLVQRHPVAVAPKCLIHNIAAEKSKVIIVADRTHAGDRLSIQLTDEKAIGVSGEKCLRIMESWIPAGGTERLYLSPGARFDARSPLRGGIPATNAFTGETVKLDALVPLDLKGWCYRVLVK